MPIQKPIPIVQIKKAVVIPQLILNAGMGPVTPPSAPVNNSAPQITGSRVQNQPLYCDVGSWAGNPYPTFAFQWQRAGANIAGATNQEYPNNEAAGAQIQCVVTATNSEGSAQATSNTVTIIAADTTPDAFAFNDVTSADRGTAYTSNEITVSGINSPSPISISGGAYSVNGGTYATAAGNVVNGDKVRVRGVSSGSYSTGTDVTLTIGGVSDTFSITTAAMPATAPGQMAAPTLSAGNGSIGVTRAAAPGDGGSPITGYDILYRQGSSGAFTAVPMTTNPQTLTGLTNGQSYEVATRAKNAVGNGTPSPVATATPVAAPIVFFDDFNRADTTDIATDGSGKWSQVSGIANALRIIGNQAVTVANEGGYRAELNLGSSDMRVEAVIPGNAASVGPFLCVRFVDQSNFVGFRYNGSSKAIQLWKRINGALTQITSGNYTTNGDTISVEAIGGDFKLLVNGAVVGSAMGHADTVLSNYAGAVPRTTAHSPWVDNVRAQAISAFSA